MPGRAPSRRSGKAEPKPRLADLASERKFVTLLRADLQRATDIVAELELEAALSRLEPALDAMRGAVRNHGGVVWKELGDGILAVFGAPLADDRHAVLACRAALDLRDRIAALNDVALQVRLGVHSGFVVAGTVKTDFAASYDLGGPPLFLVERLQGAAQPGEILASGETRGLADTAIQFQAAGSHALKGFAHPVILHRVLSALPVPDPVGPERISQSGFIGRQAEYRRLIEAAGVAAAGQGRVVTVVGEPGVGKSRLVRESAQALAAEGWVCMKAECDTILGTSPFALLRGLVQKMLAAGVARGRDLAAELAPLPASAIAVLLDPGPAAPGWAGISQRARAAALAEAVQALFTATLDAGPVLLLIEDIQWCDDASAPLLDALAGLAPMHRLLMVVTARPGGMPDWVHRHRPLPIALQALDEAGAMGLVDDLLGPAPELTALKRRILDHTGRLPLFILEVCRRLVELGAITGVAGQFRLGASTPALDVPPTLHGVIAARIDRLKPDDKRLLQTAAVIGARVALPLMEAVSGLSRRALLDRVQRLEAASLLLPARDGAVRFYEFPHELVRQVAYDALLGPSRLARHARVLEALEAAAPDAVPDLSAALVHHALAARDWARAADHAEGVARRCIAQSALADATHYFEVAIGAVDRLAGAEAQPVRAIDLRIEARVAVGNFGKVERWLNLAREAEELAKALGDDVRATAAMVSRAAALNFAGPPSEAVQVGQEAVRRAAGLGDPGWLAYAEFVLGQGAYASGHYRLAAEHLASAYRRLVVEGARPPSGAPASHLPLLCAMMQALCDFGLGDAAAMTVHHGTVAQLAARSQLPLDAVAAGLTRGMLMLLQGDGDAAEASLAAALSTARQHDVMLFTPLVGFHLGLARLHQGSSGLAREAFLQAQAAATALGHLSVILRARVNLPLTEPAGAARDALISELRLARETARQQGYDSIAAEAFLVEASLRLESAHVDNEAVSTLIMEGHRRAAEIGAEPLLMRARALLDRDGLVLVDPAE